MTRRRSDLSSDYDPLAGNGNILNQLASQRFSHIEDSLVRADSAIVLEDGEYRFQRFRMSRVALFAPADIGHQEADDFGTLLTNLSSAVNWWLGDWANLYVTGITNDNERGRVYDDLAEQFGIDKKLLRDCAYVCRNVAVSFRNDTTSFTHHRLVAALSPEQQNHWLQQAAEQGWSAAVLRQKIAGQRLRPSAAKRFVDKTLPTLKRGISKLNIKDRASVIQQLRTLLNELEQE